LPLIQAEHGWIIALLVSVVEKWRVNNMRYLKLFVLLVSVWTYGSESLDAIVDQSEYLVFMHYLHCTVDGNSNVICD